MPMFNCLITEQQQLARRSRRSVHELVPPKHPPTCEIGAAALRNPFDYRQKLVPVLCRLKGYNNLRLVSEDNEAESVLQTEMADG